MNLKCNLLKYSLLINLYHHKTFAIYLRKPVVFAFPFAFPFILTIDLMRKRCQLINVDVDVDFGNS